MLHHHLRYFLLGLVWVRLYSHQTHHHHVSSNPCTATHPLTRRARSVQGLPERWREGRGGGFFDRGGAMPPVAPNVSLHVGWFDATLPAFLRCEADAAAASDTAAVSAAAAGGNASADVDADAKAGPAADAASLLVEAAAGKEEEPVRVATARLRAAFVHIDCDLYSSTRYLYYCYTHCSYSHCSYTHCSYTHCSSTYF